MPITVWIYNSNTGAVNELPTPIAWAELRAGLGWHGPFDSKQLTLEYYSANKAANPGWKAPAGWPDLIPNAIASGADRATAGVDVLGKLDLGGWFVRIGEILLGIVLIGVGIAKLTGTTNAIAKTVKAVI